MSCFQISLGYRDKKCFNDNNNNKKIEKTYFHLCLGKCTQKSGTQLRIQYMLVINLDLKKKK